MDVFEMRRRVSDDDVAALVTRFYARVRADPALAPVFDARIATDAWPAHLSKLTDFWTTVLLGSGRYRGNPMSAHAAVPEIQSAHFARWLTLFEDVLRGLFEADVAVAIMRRARRMGDNLMAGLRA